eukprot:3660369-Prorocentrum_lima.AAC.1
MEAANGSPGERRLWRRLKRAGDVARHGPFQADEEARTVRTAVDMAEGLMAGGKETSSPSNADKREKLLQLLALVQYVGGLERTVDAIKDELMKWASAPMEPAVDASSNPFGEEEF